MSPTLGEMNPDIARGLGLDAEQVRGLEEGASLWVGTVFPVTLTEPPPRPDGKRDPIAYLPPSYRTYGIIDRDHRHRVHAGETWVVEVYERTGTYFLVPLFRVGLEDLMELHPARVRQLAEHIALRDPALASKLLEKAPPQPGKDKDLEAARAQAAELTRKLEELAKRHAALETELEQQRARAREAPPALTTQPTVPAAALPRRSDSPVLPALPGARAAVLRRVEGDVVEAPELIHPAYEAHFTADLYRVVLRPSGAGTPCQGGRLLVRGLSRVDPQPAPASYPMAWDETLGAFVAYIGRRDAAPR